MRVCLCRCVCVCVVEAGLTLTQCIKHFLDKVRNHKAGILELMFMAHSVSKKKTVI